MGIRGGEAYDSPTLGHTGCIPSCVFAFTCLLRSWGLLEGAIRCTQRWLGVGTTRSHGWTRRRAATTSKASVGTVLSLQADVRDGHE